jgi:hypothetical protein
VLRLVRLLACTAALAALTAPVAAAGERMWVGFHDDPNFRWSPDRATLLDDAKATNATVVRTLVTWAQVAPTRPARAASPFDPAYRFDDLDELVRNAQARDLEVLISVWGTPKWANGGKGTNFLPNRLADATAFGRAIASRYSGRNPGYPYVRFYSVWNEPNLEQFLAPQFNAKGRSVGPQNYAKLYRAFYAGLKAGSRTALVGIGETSPHGRDKATAGKTQDTHSPGRFAQLVAAARPAVKFDAWAHHPYPTRPFLSPVQKVKWPNVTFPSLPKFEQSLDTWFKRKNIPIWITEYGHETRSGQRGVSTPKQAAYAAQALALAKKDTRVSMFIWFVLRDNPTSLWQSGLYTRPGTPKPALARFRAAAAPLDARNAVVKVKAGTTPTVTLHLRQFAVGVKPGELVGTSFTATLGGIRVAAGQPATALGFDGTARVQLVGFTPAKGKRYTVALDANAFAAGGLVLSRTLTIVGT